MRHHNSSYAREWSQNWPIVLASAAGMAMSALWVYSTGVMMIPLEDEFGWSRAQISSGPTIVSIVGCLFAPFVGHAVDRFGPRRIGLAGACLTCLGVASLSLATPDIRSWWLLWGILAFLLLFVSPTIWSSAVSSLFHSARGFALAVAFSGTGLAALLIPILGDRLIHSFGWREAYLGLAASAAFLIIPFIYFFFSSAADRKRTAAGPAAGEGGDAHPGGMSAREGYASRTFYKLAVAAFTICVVVMSFIPNLVPILNSQGLTPGIAASIASVIGMATIAGRLSVGYLLDRTNPNIVAAVCAVMPVVASLLLILDPGSVPAAVLAAAVLGLALGAEYDAIAYLATRHFGLRAFGTLFGTISGLIILAAGIGPLAASHIYDVTGSYSWALYLYIPGCLAAALLLLGLGPCPRLHQAA